MVYTRDMLKCGKDILSRRQTKKKSAEEIAHEIFKAKEAFHREQAKLPIEEKVKILVELQKIVLNIQKDSDRDELRRVWVLE
jgi:hypothetical protein